MRNEVKSRWISGSRKIITKLALVMFILGIIMLGLTGLMTVNLSAQDAPADTKAATAESVIQKLEKFIQETKTYSAKLNLTASTMGARITAETKLFARLPKHLYLSAEINMPDKKTVHTVMVYDGTHQWGESRVKVTDRKIPSQILKLTLAEMPKREEYFSTGMHLMGSGLLIGHDLLGTVQRLISMYNLELRETTLWQSQTVHILAGEVTDEGLTAFLRATAQPLSLASMVKDMGAAQCELYVGPNDGLVKGWKMSGSDGKASSEVVISELKTNIDIADSQFEYQPAEGAAVNDITETIKQIWARAAEGDELERLGPDEETRQELKKALETTPEVEEPIEKIEDDFIEEEADDEQFEQEDIELDED